MSLYIDQKYVGMISGRLERFSKKKENLYNFRCPLCGDSKKNLRKCRGYIYQHHQFKNNLYFKCQNCGAGHTFGTLLKILDPQMFKEYSLERFKETEQPKSNVKKPEFHFKPTTFKSVKLATFLPAIETLDDYHYARAYIVGRRIPKEFWRDLYYADDFREAVDKLLPDNTHNLKANDPRIVIPFYDKDENLIAIQGRALGNNELRYITIKIRNVPKIWGLDRLDLSKHIYICEGPFDAMFLPNCIAAAGSDFPEIPKAARQNYTIIYDNEPRSKTIVKKMEQAIDDGYNVCLWPHVSGKDINQMVEFGMEPETIKIIIDKSTFSGLEATAELSFWRKC